MAEVGGIAGEQLRSYIERIERLEAEKSALAADIRSPAAYRSKDQRKRQSESPGHN